MSEWVDGRAATDLTMFCPGCKAQLRVPEGFKVPELLKCQGCASEWVLIRTPKFWAAWAAMRNKKDESAKTDPK